MPIVPGQSKALASMLLEHLPQSAQGESYHLRERGGLKRAVLQARAYAQQHGYVIKTDIANYYRSIKVEILLDMLSPWIYDKRILCLLHSYGSRAEIINGEHREVQSGIPKGGSLSPLLGGVYLAPLDKALKTLPVKVVRYMDDLAIFAKTRHQLRRALKVVYEVLDKLQLALAKDKTFIGKTSKGFDFLGHGVSGVVGTPLTPSQKALQRFGLRLSRLYEQHAPKARVTAYIERWQRWLRSGLGKCPVALPNFFKQSRQLEIIITNTRWKFKLA